MSGHIHTMSSREFNQNTGAAKKAAQQGPVFVTNRGKASHVLLSYADYMAIVGDTVSLAEALAATPGIGEIEIRFPRPKDLGPIAVFD